MHNEEYQLRPQDPDNIHWDDGPALRQILIAAGIIESAEGPADDEEFMERL